MAKKVRVLKEETITVKVKLPKSLYAIISDRVKNRAHHENDVCTVGKWIKAYIDSGLRPGAEA